MEGKELYSLKSNPMQEGCDSFCVFKVCIKARDYRNPGQNIQTLFVSPTQIPVNQLRTNTGSLFVLLGIIMFDVKKYKIEAWSKSVKDFRADAAGGFDRCVNPFIFKAQNQCFHNIRLQHAFSSGNRHAASRLLIEVDILQTLMQAWDSAIRELTRASVIVENAIDIASEREVPDILCSCLTQDCLGRGKTIKEGGAVYDFISGLQVGIANMADSLSAIKKLVYEEKKISRDELMNALSTDFAGEEGERIRQMLVNDAPKYGNDDDYADKLVVDAYASYLDEMKKYKNTRFGRGPIGGIRYGGTSSISANVGQGFGTMATPDGLHAREPLAEGCSPAHAMDKHGPTAVFKSVSKLPTHEITGGVLLNQKVTPAMLSTAENTKKLELIKSGVKAVTLAPDVIDGLVKNAAIDQFTTDFQGLVGEGASMANC